jgi:hypothetical protein
VLALCVCSTASAGASTGAITSRTGWTTTARLANGVVEQQAMIDVAGYGERTLTRVTWRIGNPHVRLDAAPALGGYTASDHGFGEGRISNYGAATHALAGINGDTFCEGCASGGGDLLHGLLVHNRRIYAFGSGPEVGYAPSGSMIMGTARAVPFEVSTAVGSATIARWNAETLPGGTPIGTDQLAVYTHVGTHVSVPSHFVALALSGAKIRVRDIATTSAKIFANLLRAAVPYTDHHDRVSGSETHAAEWVDAYRIGQVSGIAVHVRLPVEGAAVRSRSVTVPAGGVVLVARASGTAGEGLVSAAKAKHLGVRLDDAGWGTARSIMDGKYQMVAHGAARTAYPGWPDSWPWYCQNTPRGCVRAAVATTGTQGWLVVVSGPRGEGLDMPDFARVLAQLGAKAAMGFDSNTHADFWARGTAPITAGRYEPGVPAATMLTYR